MPLRIIEHAVKAGLRLRQQLEQFDGARLHGQVFRMFERQVGEGAQHRWQLLVLPRLRQGDGQRQRLGVAGKGARCAPIDIARELIEHDEARQRAVRRRLPRAQAALDGGIDQRAETRAYVRVEGVVLAEPFPARLAIVTVIRRQEPEIEYVLSLSIHVHPFQLRACDSWKPAMPSKAASSADMADRLAPVFLPCAMATKRHSCMPSVLPMVSEPPAMS